MPVPRLVHRLYVHIRCWYQSRCSPNLRRMLRPRILSLMHNCRLCTWRGPLGSTNTFHIVACWCRPCRRTRYHSCTGPTHNCTWHHRGCIRNMFGHRCFPSHYTRCHFCTNRPGTCRNQILRSHTGCNLLLFYVKDEKYLGD